MKYIRHDNVGKGSNTFNWDNGCDFCKEPFTGDEEYTRFDVQTSWMRGDDEVHCFHKKCQQKGLEQLQEKYK
jgi:hypothetical protein